MIFGDAVGLLVCASRPSLTGDDVLFITLMPRNPCLDEIEPHTLISRSDSARIMIWRCSRPCSPLEPCCPIDVSWFNVMVLFRCSSNKVTKTNMGILCHSGPHLALLPSLSGPCDLNRKWIRKWKSILRTQYSYVALILKGKLIEFNLLLVQIISCSCLCLDGGKSPKVTSRSLKCCSLRFGGLAWTVNYSVQHCPHVSRWYCNVWSISVSFQNMYSNMDEMNPEYRQKSSPTSVYLTEHGWTVTLILLFILACNSHELCVCGRKQSQHVDRHGFNSKLNRCQCGRSIVVKIAECASLT